VNATAPKGMSHLEVEQLKQTLNNFKNDTITNVKEKNSLLILNSSF